MKQIDPKDVLLQLVKDRHSDDYYYVNIPSIECPECEVVTPFTIGQRVEWSTDPQVAKQFEIALGKPVSWETDFSDIACRNCGTRFRVVHRIREVAMSCYRYYPFSVAMQEKPRLESS